MSLASEIFVNLICNKTSILKMDCICISLININTKLLTVFGDIDKFG